MIAAFIPMTSNALEFGVKGYYWFPTLKGDIVDSGGTAGTTVDLKNDLGGSATQIFRPSKLFW